MQDKLTISDLKSFVNNPLNKSPLTKLTNYGVIPNKGCVDVIADTKDAGIVQQYMQSQMAGNVIKNVFIASGQTIIRSALTQETAPFFFMAKFLCDVRKFDNSLKSVSSNSRTIAGFVKAGVLIMPLDEMGIEALTKALVTFGIRASIQQDQRTIFKMCKTEFRDDESKQKFLELVEIALSLNGPAKAR